MSRRISMIGKLVRKQIISRINKEKLIENADMSNCVSPASYELRVGSWFNRQTKQRVELNIGDEIYLKQSRMILIGTIERVNIPNDIMGMMYLRSTYARRGFMPWFQGLVDPGYRGGLTVILHNLTPELIKITGGERICHLVFDLLAEPVDKGYEGAYQGSDGATPAPHPSIVVVGDDLER